MGNHERNFDGSVAKPEVGLQSGVVRIMQKVPNKADFCSFVGTFRKSFNCHLFHTFFGVSPMVIDKILCECHSLPT